MLMLVLSVRCVTASIYGLLICMLSQIREKFKAEMAVSSNYLVLYFVLAYHRIICNWFYRFVLVTQTENQTVRLL